MPIAQVESYCENYRVALRVSYSLLYKSLGMGFMSSQTAQLMQELSSKSHAAIMSTCTQLPFVSVSKNMCWSIVAVLLYMALLWLLDRSCLRWSCFSSNIEGLYTVTP